MEITALKEQARRHSAPLILYFLLKALGLRAKLDPSFRRHLANPWERLHATIQIVTRKGRHSLFIAFEGECVTSGWGERPSPDVTMVFRDLDALSRLLYGSPEDVLMMLLRNELVFHGNMSILSRFSFLLERLTSLSPQPPHPANAYLTTSHLAPPQRPLRAEPSDQVKYLTDPALSQWTLDRFPRLRGLLEAFFAQSPRISVERPLILTRHFRRRGFERDQRGEARDPLVRQGEAFRELMASRRAIVREGDLLAGTTTEHPVGVVIYPDLGGLLIWPELYTTHARRLNPYLLDPHDARLLDEEVFPFWQRRNLKEVVRREANNPLCMSLDERFVIMFQWKAHALSHTIPDFPQVLHKGLLSLAEEASQRGGRAQDGRGRDFYRSVEMVLQGVMAYASHLSDEAARLASEERDIVRRGELEEIGRLCRKVPAQPAETLHEALQAIWITWVALHMENTNAGLSIGRLDTWLQPFLERDMERAGSEEEGQRVIERAVELVGCFFLRCTDHLPLVPDLGNHLFGGSSSDQAITLGGVDGEGNSAVCDMTYIILKVAEMLRLRDPNLNARWHPEANSLAYLRRLCEVNLLTGSTPSIHNDRAVIEAMVRQGFAPEHARDWSATGCVEPTSSGRHFGHTNSMMFSLVAPFEMALRNGYHPLLQEHLGPRTGAPEDHRDFDAFYRAYLDQLSFLADQAVECNNLYGRAHQVIRPTPLLSALFQGPMDKAMDLTQGGGLYNSSGVALIGLADVVDSMMVIERLVFQERRLGLSEMVAALDRDFAGHKALLARARLRVAKLGGDDPEPIGMANRLIHDLYDIFHSKENYRGGHYFPGYWSMSNHVAFGSLSGALPSGRLAGRPFTPGLTPSADSRTNLLSQMHAVAALDTASMPNNMAFNVKVVPAPGDSHDHSLSTMTAYAQTYLQAGGMQMQFNVVSSETLRQARAHPEEYRNLMVRISGYNAYFVELNESLQEELIDRAEHTLGG